MKKVFLYVTLLLLGYGIFYLTAFTLWTLSIEGLHTPRSETATSMGEAEYRFHLYAIQNHKLPESLNELPKRETHSNSITDFWKRELDYIVDTNKKTFTLISYGADGVKGGQGENQDIFRTFSYEKADGTFWVDTEDWISKGLVEESEVEKRD